MIRSGIPTPIKQETPIISLKKGSNYLKKTQKDSSQLS